MQGKIEIKNGAYAEYVSILISILTPQCALQGGREQALRMRLCFSMLPRLDAACFEPLLLVKLADHLPVSVAVT